MFMVMKGFLKSQLWFKAKWFADIFADNNEAPDHGFDFMAWNEVNVTSIQYDVDWSWSWSWSNFKSYVRSINHLWKVIFNFKS
jgi:hypothetical protein